MPAEPKQDNRAGQPPAANPKEEKINPGSKKPRGFAAMDPAQQRLIASQGGKASHESGRGHQFTPEQARVAGRKGGQAIGKRSLPGETGAVQNDPPTA